MKRQLLCATALAFAISASAQNAGPKIEPGLWEVDFTLKSDNAQVDAMVRQARRQVALLPPSQRKAAEDMFRARGINLTDEVNTTRICVTPEDAARGEIPQKPGARCTQQVVDRNSTSMRVRFACQSSPPASGEGTIDFQSPTAYTSQALVDTEVAGVAQRLRVDQKGRWVARDCGDVKPLGR